MHAVTYRRQNLSFVHPDHLCLDRTTYDNIKNDGPGGPFMFDIIGPAGLLMYVPGPDILLQHFSHVRMLYLSYYFQPEKNTWMYL